MEINIEMSELGKELKRYQRFVIYGAGYLAKIINARLKENNLHAEYCVISGVPDNKVFEDIPLVSFFDSIPDLRKKNVVVLIAVTELYEKEIEEILIKNKIKDYIFVTKFMKSVIDIYFEKTEQDYIDAISEWYVDKEGLELRNINSIKKQLMSMKDKAPSNDKILFIVNNPAPRVVKIARALIKRNYRVEVLFYTASCIWSDLCDELTEICQDYHACESIEAVMYYVLLSNARVVHIFSNTAYSFAAKILIDMKELWPPIVFEQYDITDQMYIVDGWCTPADLVYEKYCIEHAAGVCCRGYEQDYLIEYENYEINGKLIKFFDYCRDDVIEKDEVDNGLSLCYAGGLATEREWSGASFACFLEFAKLCEVNHCSFHLYPTRWNEERLKDYIKLDQESDYFYLHKPVPYEKLKYELTKYDYGVHPIRKDYREKKLNGYYYKEKLIYAAVNHFYDYLDAGIPIIAASPEKFIKYFEEKNVLINWTIEEYDFNYLRKNKNIMRENVNKIQDELKISNNIGRLIDFYKSIS